MQERATMNPQNPATIGQFFLQVLQWKLLLLILVSISGLLQLMLWTCCSSVIFKNSQKLVFNDFRHLLDLLIAHTFFQLANRNMVFTCFYIFPRPRLWWNASCSKPHVGSVRSKLRGRKRSASASPEASEHLWVGWPWDVKKCLPAIL